MFSPFELLKDIGISFTRKDFSIAIVGFGKMGLLHSAILNLLCEKAVRYIIDKSRLIRMGGRLLIKDVRFLNSIEKFINLEEKVDAVYITTPTQSHFFIAKRLLEAGFKNIFIEKPPTKNLEQYNELLDLKGISNVMIGFQKRFALPLNHAKLLLDKKVIGEPKSVYVSIRSGDITEPIEGFKYSDRGVLLDLGIHAIDLIGWFFGENLEIKSARCKSVYSGVDDYFEAILVAEGIEIRLDTTWSDPHYRFPETYVEIKGSEGELKVSEDYLKVRVYESHGNVVNNELILYKPHYYRGFPPVLIADPEYTIEDMHFLSTIEHGIMAITSLETCKYTMTIVEELYRRASYG